MGAGAAVGGSTGAGSGGVAAKVEVENNYLSDKDIKAFTEKYAAAKTDVEKEQLVTDLKKLDADQQKQALSTGISIADQKTELEKLKQLAMSPDCTGQCRELANYSISQLEPVVNNIQLHKNNLTKAVLASTIIALTLEQSGKVGEKAPATGTTSAGKSTSAIDDIVKGEGQAAKGSTDSPIGQQTKLTPEIETKILAGQRIDGSNRIIGGHSPNINDANPKYAVETIKVNADGTRTVKYTTQFEDGELSKIKTSTLFPEGWSDKIIIDSISKVGNTTAIGKRATTGETLYRGTVNGVEIDVIKKGNEITAGYPVGGKPTPGFNPLK